MILGQFDEAIMATLQCLSIDMELNGLPKFGPRSYQKSIKEILNNQEKSVDDEDEDEYYVEDNGQ